MWQGLSPCPKLGTLGMEAGLEGGWEEVSEVDSGREGLATIPPPEVKSMACLESSNDL